jgi:DNA-binding HxlR family transcriptional regulator
MDPADLPDIRRELLRSLWLRREAALTVPYLTRRVRQRTGLQEVTDSVITTELSFLQQSGWTTASPDPMGGPVKYHSLTPDGTKYCEANELTD